MSCGPIASMPLAIESEGRPTTMRRWSRGPEMRVIAPVAPQHTCRRDWRPPECRRGAAAAASGFRDIQAAVWPEVKAARVIETGGDHQSRRLCTQSSRRDRCKSKGGKNCKGEQCFAHAQNICCFAPALQEVTIPARLAATERNSHDARLAWLANQGRERSGRVLRGEVAEWSIAAVLKTVEPVTVPGGYRPLSLPLRSVRALVGVTSILAIPKRSVASAAPVIPSIAPERTLPSAAST